MGEPRGKSALEPELTRFDERVLNALAAWPDEHTAQLDFRTAWQVAERLAEYDVGMVRNTLRGLAHLGYVTARGFGRREEWVQSWRMPGMFARAAAPSSEQSSDQAAREATPMHGRRRDDA